MKFCNTFTYNAVRNLLHFIITVMTTFTSVQKTFRKLFELTGQVCEVACSLFSFLYPFVAVENFCSYTCTKAMSNCKNQRPINSKTLNIYKFSGKNTLMLDCTDCIWTFRKMKNILKIISW